MDWEKFAILPYPVVLKNLLFVKAPLCFSQRTHARDKRTASRPPAAHLAARSMGNMNIHFRQVTQSDMDKFPVWYEKIGGTELFSNFMPSTFVSFEKSNDILWFIIMDDKDEIGTIWFEREDPDKMTYVLGIYLNRIDLFGKGIGGKVIKSAMDTPSSELFCLFPQVSLFDLLVIEQG